MTSKSATWSLRLGAIAAAAFAAGPLAVRLGAVSGFIGFRIFLLGLLFGLVALVLGAVGLLRTRGGARAGRGKALAGFSIGLVVIAVVIVAAGPGRGLPAINDITTSPADPPAFVAAAKLPPNVGRDLSYPEEFAAVQQGAYPDLAPIRLALAPAEALRDVRQAAVQLGWVVVAVDEAAGRLEATETTRIFRFVDDVVIRIRPAPGGSVVDVRSRSRDGRGDLGANAARIRALRDTLVAR